MQRSLYSQLIEWKDKASRKPLILNGARQVGKTYLLREFGRKEFKSSLFSVLTVVQMSWSCLRKAAKPKT